MASSSGYFDSRSRTTALHFESLETAQPASSKAADSTSQPGYLDKQQVHFTQDVQFIQVQLERAKHQLALRKKGMDDCETVAEKRAKICSVCHMAGHTKSKFKNGSCPGFAGEASRSQQRTDGANSSYQRLGRKGREGDKPFTNFQLYEAKSSFKLFRNYETRLRNQNQIKYINCSALDKDLLILKKALGNKIPLNESADWELPFVIEQFK